MSSTRASWLDLQFDSHSGKGAFKLLLQNRGHVSGLGLILDEQLKVKEVWPSSSQAAS
jgi:hypothetical protein